jgi:hypothetical protein
VNLAKTDKVLIDGILDRYIAINLPSNQRSEAFEYLVYQQVLKEFDLSRDEILSGSVDGKDDGGIDAIFIFVNGRLIADFDNAFLPKAKAYLEVFIISCKHRDTFKQDPINNLVASLMELLDFSVLKEQIKGDYNADVLEKREILLSTYAKVGCLLSSFNIHLIYACRGDTHEIGDNIRARGNQAVEICKQKFKTCEAEICFLGSTEILNAFRKKTSFSLVLAFSDCLEYDGQYIVLTKLSDYFCFIRNEDGGLRRYLFDSNVRDFMGLNSVNEDILDTLENQHRIDFWWLNNGITVLCTDALVIGKTISISNVQIVNGLQTSECIYRYFCEQNSNDERLLLVKILVSKDDSSRDTIIRATNNQTTVELASLHATDKIQRDIEDIMSKSGLFYERRKNYYTNQDAQGDKIYSPLYLAAGYMALINKLPHRATTLKSRFMRNPRQYEKVFSESTDLNVWPQIAVILRDTDKQLERNRPHEKTNTESFLKSVRYIVAIVTIAKLIGRFDYSISDIVNLDLQQYIGTVIENTWKDMQEFLPITWNKSYWRKRSFTDKVLASMALKYSIPGILSVTERADIFSLQNNVESKVPSEFIALVKEQLPNQPWPNGVHKVIAQKLGAPTKMVSQAISDLIGIKQVYRQINGVVYNHDGTVRIVDLEHDNK